MTTCQLEQELCPILSIFVSTASLGDKLCCVNKCAVVQESKQAGGASHALQVAVLVNAASMQANHGQLQQVRLKFP